jgi:hypothetical protein
MFEGAKPSELVQTDSIRSHYVVGNPVMKGFIVSEQALVFISYFNNWHFAG